MTGVTALVRATAFTMEQRGVKYPGKDVRDWLRDADITHISNEVPFAHDCPYPDPVQPDMRFCSDPRYIELLEDVGTDVVELTGDHFQDWGSQAMLLHARPVPRARLAAITAAARTCKMGASRCSSSTTATRWRSSAATARAAALPRLDRTIPGRWIAHGDWMAAEIARLEQEGYLPIATFQHFEYYTYRAQPDQERDFRARCRRPGR